MIAKLGYLNPGNNVSNFLEIMSLLPKPKISNIQQNMQSVKEIVKELKIFERNKIPLEIKME